MNERFIKTHGITVTESQVKDMELRQISDLVIDINEEITELSSVKRQILAKTNDKPLGKEREVVSKINYKLNKMTEALIWVSVIKNEKKSEIYKTHNFNKAFIEVAQKELKPAIFDKIYQKAKESVV